MLVLAFTFQLEKPHRQPNRNGAVRSPATRACCRL